MEFTQMSIGELIQAGAFVVFVVLFVRGDIFAKPAVDKMLKYGRDQTKIMAVEITKDIKLAVKEGIMEAEIELNGGGKKRKKTKR